jgi:hypothetical protein
MILIFIIIPLLVLSQHLQFIAAKINAKKNCSPKCYHAVSANMTSTDQQLSKIIFESHLDKDPRFIHCTLAYIER